MQLLLLASLVNLLVIFGRASKILVVFPMPARSHYNLGSALAKGLAAAGHDVTIISPFSEKTLPKTNGSYREIKLNKIASESEAMFKNINLLARASDPNIFLTIPMVTEVSMKLTESTLDEPEFQQLLKSDERFDAIIVEEVVNMALKQLAFHFKAPLIPFSTVAANIWVNILTGNPSPPSYIPDMFLALSTNMTFFERVYNSALYVFQNAFYHLHVVPTQKQIAKKYFPNGPDLEELLYKPPLVLLNSHISTNQPVPSVPNMIDIGGFHVQPPKDLPADLQKYLDDAPNGVVYFSMGSHLKSADLPIEKRNALLKTFAKLKEKVLWKFESDDIELPPNVITRKWLPQSDILAHKNVKVFITHGGLLSTTETVYHGVPILAIPVFGDQKVNARNAVNNGFALSVDYTEISEEALTEKLHEILNNPKYRQNAKERSRIFHDRIASPMQTAVYWIEYVIRNPNAGEYLNVAGVNLPWYKYLLLDVIAFVAILVLVPILIISKLVKSCICRDKCKSKKEKVKKN